MIVSGVPRENGNAHVQHIAEIALKMRTFVANFKLAHKPEEIMMVRIGFHSGPVAAGVVSDHVELPWHYYNNNIHGKILISFVNYRPCPCLIPCKGWLGCPALLSVR